MMLNSDYPRERLLKSGVSALSDAELLAIILRSGGKALTVQQLSARLLNDFGGLKGLLEADIVQLIKYPNLGIAKATSIKASSEIGLRLSMADTSEISIISSPGDLYSLIRKKIFGKNQEYLYLVSADTRFRVISVDLISIGTVNETLVHPREVFKTALIKGAVCIALVHNHPSNDPTPSTADIDLTLQIVEAGKVIGIKLIDHIIACDSDFSSMKSLGLLDKYKFSRKGGEHNEKNNISL